MIREYIAVGLLAFIGLLLITGACYSLWNRLQCIIYGHEYKGDVLQNCTRCNRSKPWVTNWMALKVIFIILLIPVIDAVARVKNYVDRNSGR